MLLCDIIHIYSLFETKVIFSLAWFGSERQILASVTHITGEVLHFGVDSALRWSVFNSGTRVCLLSLTLEFSLESAEAKRWIICALCRFLFLEWRAEQSRSYPRAVCGAERWSSFCFITRRETAWICTDATDHWTSSVWVSFLQCVALC